MSKEEESVDVENTDTTMADDHCEKSVSLICLYLFFNNFIINNILC